VVDAAMVTVNVYARSRRPQPNEVDPLVLGRAGRRQRNLVASGGPTSATPEQLTEHEMSWYGSHPRYSKSEIAPLLPGAACKMCIYWFRTVVGSSPTSWYQEYTNCARCGIARWELLNELNQKLLGVSMSPRHSASEPVVVRGTYCPHICSETALDKWLRLYRSHTAFIKVRAAYALVNCSNTPLPILLDILDNLSQRGLGAATEKALLKRRDAAIVGEMLARLNSTEPFLREVACRVLGHTKNPAATSHLLRMIDDSHVMVRRAAGFALGELEDSSARPELERQLTVHENDDPNVLFALQSALRSLSELP